MSSAWTHSVCDGCFAAEYPERDLLVAPRLAARPRETCCFCGEPHNSGLYVREDPTKLWCKGTDDDGHYTVHT